MPLILQQTIITNFTATVLDHLVQFAIIPNMFGNMSGNKSNAYEKDWLVPDNYILNYCSYDWEDLLRINEPNA